MKNIVRRLLIIVAIIMLIIIWSSQWQGVVWYATLPFGLIIGLIVSQILVK